jgi:5-methylcytosine-specific restriction enzyme A
LASSSPLHVPLGAQSWADRKAAYVSARPSPSRVYGRRWQKLRLAYLASHPLCECDDADCIRPATIVDHRRPHHGDAGLMFAWTNLRAMCKPCHDAKTAARDGGFGNPLKP